MLIILQNMNLAENNQPFFISLMIGDLILQNCMLDSGASTNAMPFITMYKLGLKVLMMYQNICAMDSCKVKVCGLIKDVPVGLAAVKGNVTSEHILLYS